jgi:hypothetical protein
MKQFKNLRESLNDIVLDLYETFEEFDGEELNEAVKKDNPNVEGQVTNNTRGVLHELLAGKAANGGKHMPDFHLVDEKTKRKETPEQAHDRLKAQIHPKDYARIKEGAEHAASNIVAGIAKTHPGHKIISVSHTSKKGDTQKVTGVEATQKEDSSDIYIATKHPKTGKIVYHGRSLKVSENASKNVPSSSLGKKSSGSMADTLFKAHQKKIKEMHPELKDIKKEDHHEDLPAARKEWAEKNPEKHKQIKTENLKLLRAVAHHHAAELQHKLDSGDHEHVINHIRDVLHAHNTPAEKAGNSTFAKSTTYRTAKGIQYHESHPGHDFEHILKDHANIRVEAKGTSVHFHHTDPKTGVERKFATQTHKLDSQSDPLSTLKSAGKAT